MTTNTENELQNAYKNYVHNMGSRKPLTYKQWFKKFHAGMKKYKVIVTLYEGYDQTHYQEGRTPDETIRSIKSLYDGTSWEGCGMKFKIEEV